MSLKILWHSNSPWVGTGYGQQSATFGPRIKSLGHEFAFSSSWGLGGGTIDWEGIPVFPADGQYGKVTLRAAARTFGGEDCQVITLFDVWPLLGAKMIEAIPRLACWVPIDHDPIPPNVEAFFRTTGARPIAMSRFGQRKLEEIGLDPLYVPHGIDTQVFKPMPEHREGLREFSGIPADAFVVGMVAANTSSMPPRKAFPQVFQAFADFHREVPNSYLYLHTQMVATEGIDLEALAHRCGVPPEAIKCTSQIGYALELVDGNGVAAVINTFDVLANPSYGEGFGIPIVEAQACGVPVIVTDHSAMTELCGAGWLVDGEPFYNAPQGSFFKAPSVAEITRALREAYNARGDQQLRETARTFALQYDADWVLEEFWKPALEELEAAGPTARTDPAQAIHREPVEVAA